MDFLCEHIVERKKEGLYRFKKLAIILSWIVIPVILIIVCFAVSSINLYFEWLRAAIIIIPPLTAAMAKMFGPITAAYGSEAYEYSVTSGEMAFARIFGDRFRREWFKISFEKVEKCAPLGGLHDPESDGGKYDVTYKAVSSDSAPYIYYIIFRDEQDRRCLAYFEPVKKSLRMIKTYFPATVMTNLPD